jgi:PAS domain S-box-containing protein
MSSPSSSAHSISPESPVLEQTRCSPLATTILKPDGRVVYMNPPFERRFALNGGPSATAADLFQLMVPDPAEHRRILAHWSGSMLPDLLAGADPAPLSTRAPDEESEFLLHSVMLEGLVLLICIDPAQGSFATQLLRAQLIPPTPDKTLPVALELVLDTMNAATCRWEIGCETMNWNDRMRELFGIGNGERLTLADFMTRVHPEDRESFRCHLDEASELAEGSDWQHDFRVVHPERGELWISSTGKITRNAAGKAVMVGVKQDVTARHHMSEGLAELDRKYSLLNEAMMDGFAVSNTEGAFVESNSAFREMLGYTQDELLKLTYRDITPEKWHAMEEAIMTDQVLPTGYSEVFEKEYRRKDGKIIPVELRAYLIRDPDGSPSGGWAIARDISLRKKAEMDLKELNSTLERRIAARTTDLHQSKERYKMLAEATFEGIVVTENGIILDGNPQFAEIIGYTLDELIGRSAMEFVAPESRRLVTRNRREGIEDVYECIVLGKDGRRIPVEAHGRTRSWAGKTTRVTALRNLTREKEAISRIENLNSELEQAQRLALISEISAGIIHQIAQPLTTVGMKLVSANVAAEICVDPNCGASSAMREIEQDFAGMRNVMTHLRSLAHPDRPNHTAVQINEVALESGRLLRPELENRGVRLQIDLDDSIPTRPGDAVQLTQVILNLLRNASDASLIHPEANRRVIIETRMIPDEGVEIRVSDCGNGIPSELMERLFSPFFTTKADGVGIGLRISRTIIRAHGGTIEGSNRTDGPGACFRVFLPISPLIGGDSKV